MRSRPPPSNFIWNDRVHLSAALPQVRVPREGPAQNIEPFWPPAPPGTVGPTWTPELYLKYQIKRFDVGHLTRQSPGNALLRTSGFLAIFCMSGLSEQGLPLDSGVETPLTLLTLGFYTKIGGSRDPPVPRETPAQNNEGLLVLSSVPPGSVTRWRPP